MSIRQTSALLVLGMVLLGSAAFAADKQKVIVGTSASYKPWAFQKDDKAQGFEIDVWREIAKRNNYELEIKLGQFSGLVGMLDAGEIDTVAHQMSITPARLEKYAFSTPYAYSYYDFFVKNDSPLKTKEDLKGHKVGCWLGGNGEATLRAINDKYNLGLDIVTYDGIAMENEAVIGRIDAFWQGEIKTKTVIAEQNLPLQQLNEKLVYETNAYPFRKDAQGEKLATEVSKAIDDMRADGTLSQLSMKWFNVDTTQSTEK
ncbi:MULTISPECIES: transporter substrate-binding domain-containing protein [Jonquetella]|uniref:Periplasmic component of amino acid ABC-type transporter/signal transduction system n=1 Tax=Jonquetella anthropi DSM 22815 TaxID=885272 RepID=H0ULY8_9BACT|nr:MULTISPECIES: transporter substrate-binding domain-containing protein [Jonquetella]EEX47548.1 ABC transporter, substrate-binding protein, family 3 [Jonquetella anthropi E3_33 E1]EHM12530.1 periplasmic component of amino acid ABC-type transporter/signal transduction system [Jonquetella anthropi DSM 22815]ERL24634.1 putative amino-acid-binding protein YxeM [Jonquetella sp. BV3C21]